MKPLGKILVGSGAASIIVASLIIFHPNHISEELYTERFSFSKWDAQISPETGDTTWTSTQRKFDKLVAYNDSTGTLYQLIRQDDFANKPAYRLIASKGVYTFIGDGETLLVGYKLFRTVFDDQLAQPDSSDFEYKFTNIISDHIIETTYIPNIVINEPADSAWYIDPHR